MTSASAKDGINSDQVAAVSRADKCIVDLMRQARALRRVLSQLLPPKQTSAIFDEIAKCFSSTLCKYLSRLDLSDAFVRQKVSVNVSWVLGKLRTLGSATADIERELSVFVD